MDEDFYLNEKFIKRITVAKISLHGRNLFKG